MPVDAVETRSAYEAALEEFERAADAAPVPENIRRTLRVPEQEIAERIPAITGRGYGQAWRVRHNSVRGPAKGGIRFHRGLTLDDARSTAMFMTWRWGVLDIPLGGAATAIDAEPDDLLPAEVERLRRDSIEPAAAHEDAAARGVVCSAEAACQYIGLDLKGARVAVHGFGKTGSAAALLLSQLGATVTGASDTRGAIRRDTGMDIPELLRHKVATGSVIGIHRAEPITDCELLALDCDVLIVSAVEGTVRNRNAATIRARVVIEAASRSITAKADSILDGKGVLVMPDLIASAGRDAVAYYESIGEQDPYGRLRRDLHRAIDRVWAATEGGRTNLRQAARVVALRRVADAVGVWETGPGSNS